MAFYSDIRRAGSNPFAWVGEKISVLIAEYRNAVEFRRTYEELNRLSQRELDDLGISRADIARVARESVYG